MPAEFRCAECGRDMVVITDDRPPEPPLCGACLVVPGWFRIPTFRAAIAPDHDGRELCERELPSWPIP